MQEFYPEQWNLNAPFPTGRDWLEPKTYDLINSRFLVDGIDEERWQPLIREYEVLLKHKAWLQMVEVQWEFHSQSSHALEALDEWSKAYYGALVRMGRKPEVVAVERLEQLVRWAGFQHVDGKTYNVPTGEWRAGASNNMLLFTSQ